MDTKKVNTILSKCIITFIIIFAYIILMYITQTFAQWSSFTYNPRYGYLPVGYLSGYFEYIEPVRFRESIIGYSLSSPGFLHPPGAPLSAPFTPIPHEITNLLASSDLNTALEGYRLSVPYYLSDIMSGRPTWGYPSFYSRYSISEGYNIFTSTPFYPSPCGLFSFSDKFIPALYWPSKPALYPSMFYSSVKKDISDNVSIMTRKNFIIIRDFVLNNGSRETYCNMYNNNPHYQFTDEFEVFLNPSSQEYINCDAPASEFIEIVFRTTATPFKYYHVFLGVNDLILRFNNEGESEEDYRKKAEYYFAEALRQIFN